MLGEYHHNLHAMCVEHAQLIPGSTDRNGHFSCAGEEDAAWPDYPLPRRRRAVQLRGDYAAAAADFRLPQHYDSYTADEHAIWRTLYERQLSMMVEHAAPEFLAGLRC
jgi:hypothetical protein